MPERIETSPLIQGLIDQGFFDRLPRTFSTFFFDRIKDWNLLFPAEQSYFERLFSLLHRAGADALSQLFAPLRDIEKRMGVNDRTWPAREFSLANVDFLNRSPHYPAWRAEIGVIFSRIDPLLDEEVARIGRHRLVLVISPSELPVGPDRLWLRLESHGKRIRLAEDFDAGRLLPALVGRFAGTRATGPHDAWIIEAAQRFSVNPSGYLAFSYDGLEVFRNYLQEEVRKVLEAQQVPGPRQLGEKLRAMKGKNVHPDPRVAEFLRAVLLNGNGTLLINNTFVEWAAIQAFRRARPSVAAVVFGIRNKVKPFASLLLYTDQETATPVPTQMDTLGSYVDLEVFYQYLWQEAGKYPEYRGQTVHLFLAEGMDELLLIGPPDFSFAESSGPVSFDQVQAALASWLEFERPE